MGQMLQEKSKEDGKRKEDIPKPKESKEIAKRGAEGRMDRGVEREREVGG